MASLRKRVTRFNLSDRIYKEVAIGPAPELFERIDKLGETLEREIFNELRGERWTIRLVLRRERRTQLVFFWLSLLQFLGGFAILFLKK